MAQSLRESMSFANRQKHVSSGNVYRQMFDAEVQLVSSLLAHKCRQTLKPCYVVQRISSPPISNCDHENDLEKLRSEVLLLPDIVPQNRSSTNVLERTKKSKSSRHQEEIECLKEQILSLGEEFQQTTEEVSDSFLHNVSKSHAFVQHLLSSLDCHETLNLMTLHQLNMVWQNVKEEAVKRNAMISEFEENIQTIEESRMIRMTELLGEAHKQMEQIGFKSDPELENFITTQTQVLKKTMLSNRREYSRLITNMKLSDFEFEQKNFSTWSDKLDVWKDTHQRMLMGKFCSVMESGPMRDPMNPHIVLQEIIRKQSALNKKRVEVFSSIKELSLFEVSKQKITAIKEEVFEISREIDQVYEDNYEVICSIYQEVHSMGVLQYQTLKGELITQKICTEAEADKILAVSCDHVLASQKEYFEKTIERLDRDNGQKNELSLKMLKVLFNFCDAVEEIWSKHKEQLALAEMSFLSQLDVVKASGAKILENMETHLSLSIDRLRQSASQEVLTVLFKEIKQFLQEMIKCCQENYEKEIEFLDKLGPSMSELASSFVNEMVDHLAGDRQIDELDSDVPEVEKKDAFRELLNAIKTKKDLSPVVSRDELEENNDSHESISEAISNETQEEATILSCYAKDYEDLVETKVDEVMAVKTGFQELILKDLDGYALKMDHRSELFIKQQAESLNNELELKVHVIEGRIKRIHKNIFEVRQAEINLHSERFSSHKAQVLDILGNSKLETADLLGKHGEFIKSFERKVELLKCESDSSSKSSRLKKILDRIRIEHELLMDQIKASTRMFVNEVDCCTRGLHKSNLMLDKTLILFVDGGNFCLDEVRGYKQQIAKLMSDIMTCEETTMRELEGIESKHFKETLQVVRNFEIKYEIKNSYLEFEEKCEKMLGSLCSKLRKEFLSNNDEEEKLKKKIFVMHEILNKEVKCTLSQYLDVMSDANQLLVRQAAHLSHEYKDDLQPSSCKTAENKKSDISVKSERNVLSISNPQRQLFQDGLMGVLANLYKFGDNLSQQVPSCEEPRKSKSVAENERAKLSTEITEENADEDTFKGKMKALIKECSNNLKELSETFYKENSGIPEEFLYLLSSKNLREFNEKLFARLIDVHETADKYHEEALQEFEADVKRFEEAVSQMFTKTMKRTYSLNLSQFNEQLNVFNDCMKKVVEESNIIKASHLNALRPTLGHPQNEETFDELRRKERTRSNNLNKSVNRLFINKQKAMLDFMPKLMKQLTKFVINSFSELDKLYLKNYAEADADPDSIWTGLPNLDIYAKMWEQIEKNISVIPSNDAISDSDGQETDDDQDLSGINIASERKTAVHTSIFACALEIQEDFFSCIGHLLAAIDTDQNEFRSNKTAMERYWNHSLKEIKSFYI